MATYEGSQGAPEIMDPVDAGEIFPFTVDWSDLLSADSSDTISASNSAWTVVSGSAVIGDGATPVTTQKFGSVTPAAPTNTTTSATAMIWAGGTLGAIVIENQILTTAGRVHIRSASFEVKAK